MFEIQVQSETAIRLFEQLAARTSDTRPAMVAITGVMADAVEENFAVEGRPKWQNLAQATMRARKRKGTWPGKILTEIGQLAASVSPRSTNDTAVVGTNLKYAATQQFGDDTRNIPARPFLTLEDSDIGEAESILLKHLLR